VKAEVSILLFIAIAAFVVFLLRNAVEGYREGIAGRRKDRLRNRQCVACGYSLQGNASGVCPECGTTAEVPNPENTPSGARPPAIRQLPIDRGLFTRWSALTLTLCVITTCLASGFTEEAMDNRYLHVHIELSRCLGWLSVALAVGTILLLLKRASEIRRKDDRVGRGLCPNCGYDLRASGGNCPECGKISSGPEFK
jgi:hypothetical protein